MSMILRAILVLGLVLIAVDIVRVVGFDRESPPAPPSSSPSSDARRSEREGRPGATLQRLQRSDPFRLGDQQRAARAPRPSEVSEEVTTLDGYALVGTVAFGEDGVAVFDRSGASNAEVARVGELVNGWTLQRVGNGWAILAQDARSIRLVMEQDAAEVQAATAARASTGISRPAPGEVVQLGPDRWKVDRSSIEERLADLAALGREIRVVPRDAEQGGGLIVRKLVSNGLLASLGVQRGDILLRANGRDLTEPTSLLTLLRSASRMHKLTLELERDGAPLTYTYELS